MGHSVPEDLCIPPERLWWVQLAVLGSDVQLESFIKAQTWFKELFLIVLLLFAAAEAARNECSARPPFPASQTSWSCLSFWSWGSLLFPSVEAAGAASLLCTQLIPAVNAWTQSRDGAEDGRAGACPGRDSSVLGGSKNQQPLSCGCWHWSWLRN